MDEETGQPVDIPVSACNILVMYRRLWDDARGMDHLLGELACSACHGVLVTALTKYCKLQASVVEIVC